MGTKRLGMLAVGLVTWAVLPVCAQEETEPAPAPVVVVPARDQHTRVRIKDIASLQGTGGYRLLGYGLVVGLEGTGDSDKTIFTEQALKNLLEQMGMRLRDEQLKVDNVAAVMVPHPPAPSPCGRGGEVKERIGRFVGRELVAR